MTKALFMMVVIAAVLVALPAAAQDEEVVEDFVEESPVVDATPMPANTPVPAATATPLPGPGSVLLSDNFDDPTRAQLPLSSTSPQESQGYVDGEYEIINGQAGPGSVADVLVPGNYFDSSISVDARAIGGIQGRRAVQVFCRAGGGGAYALDIYPDEQRVILLRRQPSTPGSPAILIDQRGTSVIRAGEAVNRVELACVGPVITGTVNGVVVATVNDPNYTSGRSGIAARGSGTRARFDNLVVTQR